MNVRSQCFYNIKMATICRERFPSAPCSSFVVLLKALVGTSVPSLFLLSCPQVVLTTRSLHSLFLHPLHSRLRGSFFIIVNMPPYKSLAIVALAASSVFPALSAPTRHVNVYLRVRGPPDGGPIPLDRVRSSLEADLKNERTRSYWSVSRLILPCARRPFLRDRLAITESARPRLPRVGVGGARTQS